MLFLVQRPNYDYDEYDAFVVRATSEQEARDICVKHTEGEFPDTWGNYSKEFMLPETTVTKLTSIGNPEVILGSFNAG